MQLKMDLDLDITELLDRL